jgi:hypothetical protein
MARRAPVVVIRKPQGMGPSAHLAAAYNSKPGDARRSGRVDRAARGHAMVEIDFKETSAQIEARLGVVIVGAVTYDAATGHYFWAVFLPMMSNVPRPAADAGKAKAAIAHKVRDWCEAATLKSVKQKDVRHD